jgi:anti-sigma regulatory factor (Ser/Thr protein kinase)
MVSNPAYLCGVREMIAQISRRLGFTEAQCSQIALGVDEALANVMKHGYQRRIDGRIWLRMRPLTDAKGQALELVIEDEGRQVEPEQIKGRDLEDIRPGGLGVHIIREVMDEVRYEKRAGTAGMKLTMLKRQTGEKSPPQSCCGGNCEGEG